MSLGYNLDSWRKQVFNFNELDPMKILEELAIIYFEVFGIFGKELKILEPYFESIEELKGKKIAAQIKNNDLNQVANQFQVNIDTANQVLFETVFINNLGNEPKVLSYVFNGEINKNYGPIVGNTGVFVVNPTFVQKPLQKPDILMEKKTQTDKTRAEVGYRLINELSKNVKIEDNRRKFF